MRPHPILRYSRRLWVVAAVAAGIAGWSLYSGTWVNLFPSIALGLLAAWAARYTRRSGYVVQMHNAAYQSTLAGDFEHASALLDQIEPAAIESRYLERALWSQRTLIALYKGDLAAVEVAAARALHKPARLSTRLTEEQQILTTVSIRALARAVGGHGDTALADAAWAEADPESNATVLGRAMLARLVVAARAGDRSEVRRVVAASQRGRIVEELAPRERALYRSYRRLAFAVGQGAYRELASPEVGPEAEFLRPRPVSLAPVALPAADPVRVAQIFAARRRASMRRKIRRVALILTFGVTVMVALVWLVLWLMGRMAASAPALPVAPTPRDTWSSLLAWTATFWPVGFALWRASLHRSRQRRLGRAQHLDAIGDEAAARIMLNPMRKGYAPALAAQAELVLGTLEYAAARFDAAAELGQQGLARIPGGQLRALHSDSLVPALAELRAVSLAALGQHELARAELVVFLTDCPSYAFRARAEYRVALLCAVTAGDFEAARDIARTRPDAALALREEILGDLVGLEGDDSADGRARVADELAESPALAHWIDVVAPALAARGARV